MYWLMEIAGAVLGILVLTPLLFAATEPRSCSLGGTTVVGSRLDAQTGREWRLLRQCGHPERPLLAVLEPGPIEPRPSLQLTRDEDSQPPLVIAGAEVRVVEQTRDLRLTLRGTAESSGHAGDSVTVRLERSGFSGEDGASMWRVHGIVRAVGEVELR